MENTPLIHYNGEVDNPFSDKAVRNGFVRKVFTLLSVQLIFTTAVCAPFVLVPSLRDYASTHPSLQLSAIIIFVVLLLVLTCCQGFQRQWPWNIIVLFAITLSLSYLLGVISIQFTPESILLALGITGTCCVAVSLFAINTRYDFTSSYGWLFLLSMLLLLWGFLFFPFVPGQTMQKVYAGIGAAICMFYLAADVQLIMGRHGLKISPEDFVFGALTIYLDVINIFLFILTLIGERR